MDEKINLWDEETNKNYTVRLSPTSALRAQTDLSFATTLLKVARQTCTENALHGTFEVMQTSSNIPCPEIFDNDISSLVESQEEEDKLIENKENFRWSHEAIMLLLEEYKLRESSMSSGKISHKKAWGEIAKIMNMKGYDVSGKQCMTRINTMKRTYKTIKDHNSKSGNNTRTWKYYEMMENLLGEKPYMAPLTTLSSTGSGTSRSDISEKMESLSSCSSSLVPHVKPLKFLVNVKLRM